MIAYKKNAWKTKQPKNDIVSNVARESRQTQRSHINQFEINMMICLTFKRQVRGDRYVFCISSNTRRFVARSYHRKWPNLSEKTAQSAQRQTETKQKRFQCNVVAV